jgi:hypothetical protein
MLTSLSAGELEALADGLLAGRPQDLVDAGLLAMGGK